MAAAPVLTVAAHEGSTLIFWKDQWRSLKTGGFGETKQQKGQAQPWVLRDVYHCQTTWRVEGGLSMRLHSLIRSNTVFRAYAVPLRFTFQLSKGHMRQLHLSLQGSNRVCHGTVSLACPALASAWPQEGAQCSGLELHWHFHCPAHVWDCGTALPARPCHPSLLGAVGPHGDLKGCCKRMS